MIYTIKNEQLTVEVDSFGAQMMSVRSSLGYEYMWQGREWWHDRCPILFPTCGNCPTKKYYYRGEEYKLPIHGIAMYREFKLIRQDETSLLFSLESDGETRQQYPFDFELLAEFTLSGKTLTFSLTPKNTGDNVMPYMVGWHPGFNLWGNDAIGSFYVDFGSGDNVAWYPIPESRIISKYAQPHALDGGRYYLNEDEIYTNDTMIFENYPTSFSLCDGSGNARISMSVSNNLPFFCIWKEPHSEARFICLEPWNNIFNSDGTTEDLEKKKMARLAPGETETYSYKVSFN